MTVVTGRTNCVHFSGLRVLVGPKSLVTGFLSLDAVDDGEAEREVHQESDLVLERNFLDRVVDAGLDHSVRDLW
jgi:hypothetical protein